MNKVYLIGNLTRDPEPGTTASGVNYCRMSIAVNRRFANPDGTRDVDYFNITAWRGLADNCAKYQKKGNKIAVVGSIQTRTYDKQDGTKGFSIDISAEDIEFLSPKGDSGASVDGGQPVATTPVNNLQPIDDSDLPF